MIENGNTMAEASPKGGFCQRAGNTALRIYRSERLELFSIVGAWLFNLAICASMIKFMPWNDEQWTVSMAQAAKYLDGEHNYANLQGPEGQPLLHPAGHVYASAWMHYLTDGGENVFLARIIFGGLYMATLAVAMSCYQQTKMGYLVYFQMGLSAKLLEIYVARCSIECFAVFYLWSAIHSFQARKWMVGAVAYSVALVISSHMILAAPAVAVVALLSYGVTKALGMAVFVAVFQIIISYPFISTDADMASYLAAIYRPSELFDYGRSIWSFLPESSYNSRTFACVLATALGVGMAAFAAYPWLKPTGHSLPSMLRVVVSGQRATVSEDVDDTASRITPVYVADAIHSSLVLSFLFMPAFPASSYAYIAWGTPMLLQGVESIGSGISVYLLGIQHVSWSYFPRGGYYGGMILVACQVFPLGVSFLKAFTKEQKKPVLPQHQEFVDEKKPLL